MRAALFCLAALGWALTPAARAAPRQLRLEDAVQTALEYQPLLLQAEASVSAARGRSEQTLAPLLPQVNSAVSATRGFGTDVTWTGASEEQRQTSNFFSAGLSLSQTVWDFAAIERLRAANRFVDAQRALGRATRIQVALNARVAFFNARAQRALVRVAEENLDNTTRHLKQVEGFVREGTQSQVDLAQAQTLVANAEYQGVNAQNGYRVAVAQLKRTLGIRGGDFDVADDEQPPVPGETASLDALVDEALKRRPELASLARQREAQELTATAALATFIPALGTSAGVVENGTQFSSLGFGWNLGVTLSWPIFPGGLPLGQAHEARANATMLYAQEEGQRLQVQLDVETARLNLTASLASLGSARAALENARVRLRLAEGRYSAGVGTALEISDAQLAVTNAGAQLVQAEFNVSASRAQLLGALGRVS